MNKSEKSLRWVVNQIPDFKPTTNEEKMLVAIKLYSEAGAEEIRRLETENAALRERLEKAVEFPCKVGDNVFCIVGIDPAVEEFKVEEILIKRLDPIFAVFRLRGIDIGVKTSCVLSQFGKRWFTELEDAEARLAKLKGGKK